MDGMDYPGYTGMHVVSIVSIKVPTLFCTHLFIHWLYICTTQNILLQSKASGSSISLSARSTIVLVGAVGTIPRLHILSYSSMAS